VIAGCVKNLSLIVDDGPLLAPELSLNMRSTIFWIFDTCASLPLDGAIDSFRTSDKIKIKHYLLLLLLSSYFDMNPLLLGVPSFNASISITFSLKSKKYDDDITYKAYLDRLKWASV